jgi:alcohol dehydrogenase class IV
MWTSYNPVDVHAGCGSLKALPRLLGARRAVLIAFPEATGLGLVERIHGLLGERLAGVETGVLPNPDVAWLAPMYERLWRDHADVDCVIALGGGSVIDCAKVMLTRPERAFRRTAGLARRRGRRAGGRAGTASCWPFRPRPAPAAR